MDQEFGEYDSPLYRQVVGQLDAIADRAGVERGAIARLRMPKRTAVVAVPVRMDDGSTRVFRGYRVQHAITTGPGKGGLRYHPDVTLGEVAGLAALMGWKCGLMGLPFGGAKGGVNCDPHALSAGELERLTRRLTIELLPFIGPMVDVMAPDVGTNEQVMAWIYDTYSMHAGHNVPQIVTGKSVNLYGTVGRREATGRGVVYTIEAAAAHLGLEVAEARVVVQGFGNVGSVAARELHQRGARVIAVGDATGALHRAAGIDIPALTAYAETHGGVAGFPEADAMPPEELLTTACEILVPAALERVITEAIAPRLRCRVLAEAANGPTTGEADAYLREQTDIHVIPDILCNAGGVSVSYFEWVQDAQMLFWEEEEVNRRLRKTMHDAFARCQNLAAKEGVDLRTAAMLLAVRRIALEKQQRGLFP
jgi:glutamate dehydrogenase (NAD(P)+)